MRVSPLVALFALGACVPTFEQIRPAPTVITNYKVGEILSVSIGDPIIDVQAADKVPEFVALRAHDPGRVRLRGMPKVRERQRFRAVGRFKTGNYIIHSADYDSTQDLVVTPEGRVLGFYDGRGGAVGGSWPQAPLFASAEGLEGQPNAFRAQMIYSGLDGNTIRATYREFSGDFIRSSFSQELQYNLAQDSTIAYKTIKIDVLQATNSQLRYRVREDGNLPWLPGGGANVHREPSRQQ